MPIIKRNFPGNKTQDQGAISNITYSEPSGAVKVAEVGRHLLPIPTPGSGTGYTTDVSGTPRSLPFKGINLAVYNNANAVGSITLGSLSSVASLASGATDAAGNVGIPCPPNAWTYIATSSQQWAISSAATLLVFTIDDVSNVQVVSQDNAST